jgi:hypothetical protein
MSTGPVVVPEVPIVCAAGTVDNSDGHSCFCPICSQECNVVVTEVPFLDETGTQRGFTSDYDLTEYTDHYTTVHPDGT